VLRQQAFQFELRPNADQKRQFCESAGVYRLVFNGALALQRAEIKDGGRKKSGYAALCRELTA
jgi:putative transposase